MNTTTKGGLNTDLGGYFQILIGILMASTFVTLILILLGVYYGKEEQETAEED
jgi:hypothetical protein